MHSLDVGVLLAEFVESVAVFGVDEMMETVGCDEKCSDFTIKGVSLLLLLSFEIVAVAGVEGAKFDEWV